MLVQHGKKKVPILMYHSISHSTNRKFKQFTVSPFLFAEQMSYLHQHAYVPITVTQFVNGLSQGDSALPERPVILTFDDGFADFFTDALPVLKQYGFSATMYIITAFVNSTSCWLQREREASRPLLTWHQITQMHASGIEVGAHTHTHPQLDMLSASSAQNEIVISKKILEDHLGQKVSSFAYPFGYYTPTTQRLVQAAGYTSACAVKHAMSSASTNPFVLARLMVKPTTNIKIFATLLTDTSSYATTLSTTYARIRTPIWQFVRRSSLLMSAGTDVATPPLQSTTDEDLLHRSSQVADAALKEPILDSSGARKRGER